MSFRTSSSLLISSRILPALLLFSSVAFAQSKDLQYLLFEPSVLNAEQPAEAAESDPSTLEASDASAVPPVAPAITLQDYLHSKSNPSPEQLDAITGDIANYKKVIQDLELQGGAYEARLSEELLSLASLYKKAGDLAEAQKILNRAAYITRVNNGLFDESQIPVLKKVIENYVDLGDLFAADKQQETLFYMQRKLYGDSSPDLLPGLKYFAEWNLFAATTTIRPPPVTEDGEPGKEPVVDTMSFQFGHLVNAQNLYDQMAQILIANPGFNDDHLAEAEKQILVISHLFATRYNAYMSSFDMATYSGFGSQSPLEGSLLRRNDLSYRTGTDILQARIERLKQQQPIDLERVGKAQIELADWLLVFSRRMTALEELETSYQELAAANLSADELDQLFHPALPQQIPVYLNSRYSRGDLGIPPELNLQYKGYIDLEFELSRFGVPSAIKVLGTSPETDEEITAHLVNHIRYSQFRPRVEGGTVKNEDRFQVRYNYTY